MSFESNAGQKPSPVNFVARGGGYTLELAPTNAHLSLFIQDPIAKSSKALASDSPAAPVGHSTDLNLQFLGANSAAKSEGLVPLPGKSNYFMTSDPKTWFTNIPTYSQVAFHDLYPGVDLVYYGNQSHLEYDFLVAPGANPDLIQLQLQGAKTQTLATDGSIVAQLDGTEVHLRKPVIYQLDDSGKKEFVEGNYVLEAANLASGSSPKITFQIGAYDAKRLLIIDPVLSYSSYQNGWSGQIDALAVDSSGNLYIAAYATSTAGVGITKISPDGSTVLFTTTLGSGINAYPTSIALGSTGKIYFTGTTSSTSWPTTSNAFQQTFGGGYDSFVTVLDPTGASLLYSTYLGGSGTDYNPSLAVDTSGKIYVNGFTGSTNFPTTTGAFQTTLTSSYAQYVAKFDPTLSGAASLVYSTLLNNANYESYVQGPSIAVDSTGNAYVLTQGMSNFPVTNGAYHFDGTGSANGGIFITKLNSTATQLVYSAYLAPGNPFGLALDGAGSIYVTGTSTYSDFPTTSGAYQTSYPGAFVSKLSADGSSLVYSTFINGPSQNAFPTNIAIVPGCASNCSVYIAGYTGASDFPTVNPIQNFLAGTRNIFITQLSGDGSAATFSSYFGGTSYDGNGNAFVYDPLMAVDPGGNIYFGASTSSSDLPVTMTSPYANQFIAKVSPTNASTVFDSPSSLLFNNLPIGVPDTPKTFTVRNLGSATLTISSVQITGDFAQTNTCGTSVAGGGSCTVTVTFTPTLAGTRFGTVTINSSANNTPSIVSLQGTGQDSPFVQILPSTLTFPSTAVGSASAPQTLTVSNIGNQPLTVFSIAMYDTLNFSQTNNCPENLGPGLTCTVNVVFSPSQPSYFSTTLYPNTNGPGGPNQSTTLMGAGILSTNKAAGTLSATALNFATLPVGNTSATAYIYLTSTGSAPLTVTGASITPGDFSFINYCNATSYAPGGSCQFNITFKPTAAGVRTATLTITDDGVGSPHTVTLTGTGVLSTSTIVVVPTSITFTPQVVGTVSAYQAVEIFNTGTAPVTIDRIEGTPDFSATSNYCTGSIAVGSTCTFYVYFQPQAAGTRAGNITIVDSATGSPHLVAVSGTGVSVSTGLVPGSTSLVFDPQVVNTASPVQTLYFNNSGNVPVSVSSALPSGDYSFTYDGCTGVNIAVNSYCQLNVVFTPTNTGARTGTITITSNDSGSPYSVSLTGTGVAAAASLVPNITAFDFGPVVLGTTTTYPTITFTNTGNVPVTVGTATITGDFALQYDNCSGVVVSVGGSCPIYPVFTPTAAGTRTGTISVPASDSGTAHTVSLTGIGVTAASEFVPSASGIVFAPQAVGTTSVTSQQITFTNTGNVPVTITSDVVTGDFALSYDGCAGISVPVASTCYFDVTFTPTTTGTRNGNVTVTSSDSGSPHTINFSGNGVAASQTLLFTPASMDFGTVDTATSSSPTYIYVRNTGTEDVLLSAAITATGDFTIGSNACGGNGNTITAGTSCYLYLTFTPAATGTRTGVLTFTDSATGSPQTVNLTGVGVSTPPVFQFLPNYLAFDAEPVATPSTSTSITLLWGGTGPFAASNITASGDFSIADFGSCASATPAGTAPYSCYVNVIFNPSATGVRTGTLTVTDNVAGSPHKASLFGYGLASSNAVYITPSGLNFTDQVVGVTSPNLAIQLTNIGNIPLNISTVTVTGDFAIYNSYYSCGGGYPYYSTIAPGSGCPVTLTFTPTATGNRTGTLTITDSSSTNPHSIPLTGKGLASNTSVTVDPAAITFPDQPQNTTSPTTQTVNLTNNGNVPITISSVTVSGDFANTGGYYSCGGGYPYYTTLAPNTSCPVPISFTPTATGTRTGTLTITDSSATSPHHAALTGKGITNITTAVVTPTSVGFLDTPQNTTSAQQTVTLTNTGNVPITITSATVSGDFAISSVYNCGNASYFPTLAPNATCPVYLTFTPTATGTRTGTLTITDSATNSPQLVALKGKGITSVTTASVTPTVLPFPDTPVNVTSAFQTVTLTNTGNIPLNNIAVSLTAGDFSIYTPYSYCGAPSYPTLNPGGTCNVYFQFAPTASGTRTATFTITSSATNSPQTVSLTGKGVTASLTSAISPGSINFGAQTVGVTTTYTAVTYTNTGNSALALSAFNVTGDFSIYSNGCSTSLAPASSCPVYLNFTPTTSGSRTGTFSITDNSTGSPHTVALSGTGVTAAQAVQLSQTSVTFGNTVTSHTSPPMLVYQYNQGAPNVTISNLVITGDFSFTNSTCYIGDVLSQGTSCYYYLTFTPTAANPRTGTLTITDSATGSPRTITLNGTGVNPYPIVSFNPGNLTFGSVNLGVTSAQQAATLTNTGTANLTFTPSLTTVSGDFAIASNNCVSPLVPTGSCTIYLTFKPTVAGTRSGTLSFPSNASTTPDHVNLFGTGLANGPAVVFTPDNLSFASQPQGTTSAAQNISLSNPGNATLTFTSIVASGDFAQTNNCGASIPAGGSCTISVTFTPTAPGNRGGLITVTDNASGSPHRASLAGVGIGTPATATPSPSTLVFASQIIHVPSSPQTVTLTNTGSSQLNISNIVATGDFSQSGNCSTVLAGNSSCSVNVTFTPTAAGSRTGTLTFTDNATNSPQVVTLSGTGVVGPLVALAPTSLTFPSTNVGSSSATQSITLTNTGTAALAITSIASGNTEFTQTNNCPASVAINGTCTITVTFKPDQYGGLGGNISVTDNAYDSPQVVSLFGTGAGPGISLSPGSLTFANQATGTTSASQAVTLSSIGTTALTISNIAVGANYLQTNNCPASLASGLNCTINVSFKPATVGTLTGSLSITDNAAASPQSVSLSGVGTGAVISLNPTSLTFASQTVNTTSAPQNVTVTNTGNSNLTISNISSSDGEFAFTNNCPGSIVPSTPCTIAVTFTPSSPGSHSATFTITDNAVGNPHTFTASGTATGVPAVSLTPAAPLTFPGQSVNTTSASQNVTLTNSGGAPLTVTSVLISGDFADTQNCTSAAIPASGTCTISVTFTPTAAGTRTGTLTFNDNATGSPQTYALSGTGIGVPGISFNPASLTFASQTINTTSAAQNITVTSSGSAVLNITGIVATGDFSQTNNCPASMAVGASCTVSVKFTPTATGTRSGSIQFTDNAPLTPQSVPLTGTGTAPVLVSISVAPTTATIAKGTTQQFTATGHYNDSSTQNLTSSATWTSSATGTATINAAGLATGVAAGGPVTITATSASISGTASLTVTGPNLVSIAVTPANASIPKGSTQQYTATGTYTDSSTQNITSSVTWSSSAIGTASITSAGLATGVAPGGPVTITATSAAISGSTSLTVTGPALQSIAVTPANTSIPKGTTQQYTATGTYTDSSTQNITGSVTWSTSNSAIASILPTGVASGVAVGGPVTVTATSGAITGTTSLTVTPGALSSITVSPSAGTIAAGQTQAFTATGHYTDGTTQNLTSTVAWTSSNNAVATIAATGVATGVAQGGPVTITATSGAITGTASLTVTPAALTSITVTPATASIAKGTTQQFTATGHYSDSSTQNITTSVVWSSSNSGIGNIASATGLATGVAVGGPVTITATSAAISGTASLTVTSPTLVSIAVAPASASIAKGTTQQYTATGTYTDSSTQNITGSVTWGSSAIGTASITSTGLATGVAAGGPVTITATSGAITGTASLTVTSPTLVSIAVTPASASIAKGTTQQYTATGTYTDSSTQNITGSVTWSSSAIGTASITSTGLATGVAAGGPVTITATSGAITGTASLTVTPAVLTSITVSPSAGTVAAGQTLAFTATGHYSDSTTQNLTSTATWASSNTSVATIAATGVATGVALGGPINITATSGAIVGTASLTVTNATLSSITVTPASASIAKGTTQQFTATGHYSDSSTQNLTGSVVWTSSATGTATINSAGLATGVAVGGPATITATSGVITGTASLTITSPILVSIAVTPASSSIVAGTTQQYTATGTYSDSSTQNLTGSVTWTSSSNNTASISSTGLASGVLAGGPVTITATSGAITGTASLTVTAVVVQNPVIAVNPLSLTFANQVIGTTSAAQSISVSNTGTAALTISSIALTGANSAEYAQTNNCPISPSTLAASTSCTIQVTFVPLAIGTRTASVTLTDNTNGVPGSQQNVALSGTASAAPPTTSAPIPISFTPGTNVSQVATVNCPSGTSPCTDANAHSLKVAISQVNTPFTLTVTAHEVSLTEANGVCEAGQTETTDFDCRFKQYFSYQTQPNGDVIVPQCIPYSNGNCVYYTIGNVPPGSAITGPIFEYVAWNNSAFTPPSFYQTSNPRFFDDPDEPPYDVNHQFALDITDFYQGNGGHVGTDPGLSGHTKHFTDFVVAFPALLPNPPYSFAYVAPLGTPAATFTQGTVVPVKFTLLSGTTPVTNATTPPNAVSFGVLNSSNVRVPALAPDGSAATLTYDPVGQQYVSNLSTQGFAPGVYTFFANSNLFTQQTTTFTVTAVPLQIVTTSPLATGTAGLVYSQAFAALGGSAPYSWILQSGALPTGLTLSTAGFLNGVPTAGTYNFTLQVTDAASTSLSRAYSVVINPAALLSIAVTPANASVLKGSTLQFVATGTYTDSSTQNITNSVTWSSSSAGTATIGSTGLATGVAFGSTTITATQAAISGSTSLSVKILGDVNGDGVVNCADLAIVKASYGKKTGQPGFDPRADVNGDGVVNVLDLAIVSKQLPAGTTCP